MFPELKQNKMTTIEITIGQVKEIAKEVSVRFEVKCKGDYYNVIDRKTRKSSIEGGDKNLTYYSFFDLIRFLTLKFSGKTSSELDWSCVGVDVSDNNQSYLFKIKDKIVELIKS